MERLRNKLCERRLKCKGICLDLAWQLQYGKCRIKLFRSVNHIKDENSGYLWAYSHIAHLEQLFWNRERFPPKMGSFLHMWTQQSHSNARQNNKAKIAEIGRSQSAFKWALVRIVYGFCSGSFVISTQFQKPNYKKIHLLIAKSVQEQCRNVQHFISAVFLNPCPCVVHLFSDGNNCSLHIHSSQRLSALSLRLSD